MSQGMHASKQPSGPSLPGQGDRQDLLESDTVKVTVVVPVAVGVPETLQGGWGQPVSKSL